MLLQLLGSSVLVEESHNVRGPVSKQRELPQLSLDTKSAPLQGDDRQHRRQTTLAPVSADVRVLHNVAHAAARYVRQRAKLQQCFRLSVLQLQACRAENADRMQTAADRYRSLTGAGESPSGSNTGWSAQTTPGMFRSAAACASTLRRLSHFCSVRWHIEQSPVEEQCSS